jgi:excisionase family DNA binding protein
MITENGTNLERDLALEVPTRTLIASEAQTAGHETPSQPPRSRFAGSSGSRKPRRPATVPTHGRGKSGAPLARLRDIRGQAGAQLSSESESLASLVRQRRTAWTAEELAEVLSLSRKHIYKLAKKGRMPSLRIGGAIRFDPHATAAWLESKAIQ